MIKTSWAKSSVVKWIAVGIAYSWNVDLKAAREIEKSYTVDMYTREKVGERQSIPSSLLGLGREQDTVRTSGGLTFLQDIKSSSKTSSPRSRHLLLVQDINSSFKTTTLFLRY